MTSFQFEFDQLPDPNPDGIAGLQIKVGGVVFTELMRRGQNTVDAMLRVPAAPLAFWLAEKWWRLRWEPKIGSTSHSWHMSHELPAIGQGHAWPKLTLWGDRDRVMLVSKADPPGIAGPVRFTTNAVVSVPAEEFEATLDRALDVVRGLIPNDDRNAFNALLEALRSERGDPESARWRRLEAICGYNPDEAPDELINGLLQLENEFKEDDVEDAIAGAPGENAARNFRDVLAAAEHGMIVDFTEALRIAHYDRVQADSLQPWQAAENLAAAVRDRLGLGNRPLRNKALGDLVKCLPRYLSDRPNDALVPYGLRLMSRGKQSTVLLTARWTHDRRFQLARTIGDAIWTEGSNLGAISNISSSRQKFQRSFAAALLCPVEGLWEFLNTTDPTDSDIAAAAKHFHVNEKTVRTVLVNKRLVERGRLDQPLSDLPDAASVDEFADAA